MNTLRCYSVILAGILLGSCESTESVIQTVTGQQIVDNNQIWLSHEHILVDFIGADHVKHKQWNPDDVIAEMKPRLMEINEFGVSFFVDATPNYLARDVRMLKRLSEETGIHILTNTGFYGAVRDKYIPDFAFDLSPTQIAQRWIDEYREGIDGTGIKPGFIKISVDASDTLDAMDSKLVQAAALAHLETGLTIGSHTGPAEGLYPQLRIVQDYGVSPEAFIWIHAQAEPDNNQYLQAAKSGCWISLDGLGWELDSHVKKLVFAKENGILDQVLISHDAGWYDPGKVEQDIKPFTNLFIELLPRLKAAGFGQNDINLLLKINPANAFTIRVRTD